MDWIVSPLGGNVLMQEQTAKPHQATLLPKAQLEGPHSTGSPKIWPRALLPGMGTQHGLRSVGISP